MNFVQVNETIQSLYSDIARLQAELEEARYEKALAEAMFLDLYEENRDSPLAQEERARILLRLDELLEQAIKDTSMESWPHLAHDGRVRLELLTRLRLELEAQPGELSLKPAALLARWRHLRNSLYRLLTHLGDIPWLTEQDEYLQSLIGQANEVMAEDDSLIRNE